jgi:phospholipid-binding lipoprotein MlaA
MDSLTRIAVLALAFAAGGCATNNPRDPLEPFNRAMFDFNDTIDKVALKPTAEAYSNLPFFMQAGVSNFFGNIADVWTAVNNLLQGKPADGVTDVMRVAVNTTFGLFGLIDIASEAGMPKHKADFGQTLGKWGVQSGPYVMLPFFGPSTLRDSVALPVDLSGDPWGYKYPVRWRNAGRILRVVDQRAGLLGASSLLEDAALDRYSFVRDAYLQRRESKIREGDSAASYEYDVGPTPEQAGDAPDAVRPEAAQREPVSRPLVKQEHRAAEGNPQSLAAKEVK